MGKEYNKKLIIIDNIAYELQEIRSVSEYNNIKKLSEEAKALKLINSSIAENERMLIEKQKELQIKKEKYYSKTNLLTLISILFSEIEYGFIEDDGIFEECQEALKLFPSQTTEEIISQFDLVKKEYIKYFGELL